MYTVIFPSGRVLVFNLKSCADLYVQAYGGTLVTEATLKEEVNV